MWDTPNQFQSWCYVGRLDESGNESWQYQETNCYEDYAIGPDGTIFLMEDDFQNNNWSQVTALDPNTGQIKFAVPLPSAGSGQVLALNFSYVVGSNGPSNPPYCTPGTSGSIYSMPGGPSVPNPPPAEHGGFSVSSDGTVYLPITTNGDGTLDAGACNPGSDPTNPATINPSQATGTSSSYLQLLVIHPDGSSSIQQVDSASTSFTNWYQPQITSGSPRFGAPERAVPDGNGGVFLPAVQTLYHGIGSGFTYSTLPIIAPHCYDYARDDCDPLLLGEDGTAYLVGYSSPTGQIDTATAIDPNSGSPKWTWQAPGVNLSAVASDGTLAVQAGNSLQLIDPTGQATPALSTTLVGAKVSSYGNGNWAATLADGSLALVTGNFQVIANSEHARVNGNTQQQKLRQPSAKLELRFGGNLHVSAADKFANVFINDFGETLLGMQSGGFNAPQPYGRNDGCYAGYELVATVTPASSKGPVTIKRFIPSIGCYVGSQPNPAGCGVTGNPPYDDTGKNITTNPAANSNGQVFNLDSPGFYSQAIPSNAPLRDRINFEAYAVGPDGTTQISQKIRFYVRLSCQSYSNGIAYFNQDVSNDNQLGTGTTPTTWKLQ